MPKSFNNVADYFSQLECTTSDELGWTGLRLLSASETANDVMFSTNRQSITLDLTGTSKHLSVMDGWTSERATDPGDICLVPAGIDARFSWTIATPVQHSIMVDFDHSLFTHYCPEIATGSFLAGHLEPRDFAPNPHVASLMGLLARELDPAVRRGRLFSESAIRLLAMEVATTAWTRKHSLPIKDSGFDSRIRVAIDFIEANYLKDISLSDLGLASGLGTTRLVYLFKLETGHTPYAYVVRRRLRHAVKLLRTTTMPIASVAIESGFSDQQHMTRLFKQYLCQTPGSFRGGC